MTLRLANATVRFNWDSAAMAKEAIAIARTALILTGEEMVKDIKAQDIHTDLPFLTGALAASIRLAPPGYNHNDLPAVNPNGYGVETPNVDLASPSGRTRGNAMEAQRLSIDPNALLGAEVSEDELIEAKNGYITTWVGSFLPYSWFQHQGFNHVGREKAIVAGMAQSTGTVGKSGVFFPPGSTSFIQGRPYISQVIDAEGRAAWVRNYRKARGQFLMRGA